MIDFYPFPFGMAGAGEACLKVFGPLFLHLLYVSHRWFLPPLMAWASPQHYYKIVFMKELRITPETSCQGLFNQIHKKATILRFLPALNFTGSR